MDNIQLEFTQIQLSPHQVEFMKWCNDHYHQLVQIKKSGYLNGGGRSFTVHLKDSNLDIPPIIDKIDLHDHYYPS